MSLSDILILVLSWNLLYILAAQKLVRPVLSPCPAQSADILHISTPVRIYTVLPPPICFLCSQLLIESLKATALQMYIYANYSSWEVKSLNFYVLFNNFFKCKNAFEKSVKNV